MSILHFRQGRVICPAQRHDVVTDLWLDGDRVGGFGAPPRSADRVIDCAGKIVVPGLIDMHVHLREPGREEDETIATGTASAVAGGVTSVACMPNTEPPLDHRVAIEFVILQAQRAGNCNVFPIGAISKRREGKELAEMGGMVAGGAVAFTDDGSPVASGELMRRACEYARMLGKAILVHAEVPEMTVGGTMNEGEVSTRLGLRGMPAVAEEAMIYRDIALAGLTGGRVHILHVSTAEGVDLIRRGRSRGFPCSGEACPHHFIFTDERVGTFDTNFKMSPPLRTRKDVEGILEGLKDDTLTVLATDHAPHSVEKKSREFDQTPNGILGLETFLAACITHLIEPGILTWPQMIAKMTTGPAEVLGIDRGTLKPGAMADVTVIDPKTRWTVNAAKMKSKSRNTPWHGMSLIGRATTTIVSGIVRYEFER